MKTRFQGPRADYTYTVEGSVIAIVDLDQGSKSVTNDMDNVLDDIRAELGDLSGYSVIYRDSTSRWDGVRLVGRSVEFYSLNETDPERAASRLLHLLS
ncbi:hypothetical protein [Spirosoma endophyticum]|uniref:Uncharacterized protein n=1 Tax=Spirosoma endophyticum TaxID=662367 RepID=A0A1I2HVL6_9BACT|nr:hypothetical protein [Spirosoma endophyticum]SFF34009.1 hypothetical protein SAMN05216167_15013 [Spirosoma endophyticum]